MSWVRASTMVAVGVVASVSGYWIGARRAVEAPPLAPPFSAVSGRIVDSANAATEVGELIDRTEGSDVANYAFREAEFLAEMIATGDSGKRTNRIGETYSLLPSLFKAWARREPEAALAAALAAALGVDEGRRHSAIVAVFDSIFEIDPDRGLAMYEGLPSELQSIDLELGWIVHFMADASPSKAVEWIFGRMDVHQVPIERRWDELVYHGAFDELDGAARMEWFRHAEALGWNPEFQGEWLSDDSAIHNQMAREHPGAALAWMRENAKWAFVGWNTRSYPQRDHEAGGHFAEAVLTHGIAAAEGIWGGLEPGGFRTLFAIDLALSKAAFDPGKAIEWVAGIDDAKERQIVGWKLFESWTERDPSEVENYLRTAGEDGESWLPAALPASAKQDAARAFGWLQASYPDDTASMIEMAYDTGLFLAWADQDPKTAAGVAAGLDDDGSYLVRHVLLRWARKEPASASRYISEQMGAGGARDQAVAGLALAINNDDPALAAKWAKSIGDDTRRQELLRRLEGE